MTEEEKVSKSVDEEEKEVVQDEEVFGGIPFDELSFTELHSMYTFVTNDLNGRRPNITSKEALRLIRWKMDQILSELYVRTYGCDIYSKFPKIIAKFNGQDPYKVDLDRFVTVGPKEDKTGEE